MHDALADILTSMQRPAIAVSGGVDSVTLAAFAANLLDDVLVMHASSPAVPDEATARVRRIAAMRGWRVSVIRAGEFDDPDYRANPVNRCYYCKSNLYATIRAQTDRQILSGANLDDLGEYRPGLDAARENLVRHPYIEAGMGKRAVRELARELGLNEVAELPSSPCLSSRVETGIRIEASALRYIHEIEQLISGKVSTATVRCRVRAHAVVIEIDSLSLQLLSMSDIKSLIALVENHSNHLKALPVQIEPYRNGSAFLRDAATPPPPF